METENIRILQKILPQVLMSVAISLESIHDYNYAWSLNDALTVIEILTKARVPILGGDVYLLQKDKPIPTIDSWYIRNPSEYKSPKTFLEDSEEKAINYINAYAKRNGQNYCYSFTLYRFPLGN